MFYNENNNICVSDEDDCNTCTHVKSGDCPLIQVLYHKLAYLSNDNDVIIKECEFYEEYSKKVVSIKRFKK